MSTPVIMANTAQVEIWYERSGQERRNVIHFNDSGSGFTAADLTQLASEVETQIVSKMLPLAAQGTRFYNVRATDIRTPTGPQVDDSFSHMSTGGLQVLPANSSFCLSKHTLVRGRSYQGRFYLADLSEDFFNGDYLNPIYVPGINDLATQLLSTRVSGKFKPAVGSRKLLSSTKMQSISYDFTADSQRRRLPGRGY